MIAVQRCAHERLQWGRERATAHNISVPHEFAKTLAQEFAFAQRGRTNTTTTTTIGDDHHHNFDERNPKYCADLRSRARHIKADKMMDHPGTSQPSSDVVVVGVSRLLLACVVVFLRYALCTSEHAWRTSEKKHKSLAMRKRASEPRHRE